MPFLLFIIDRARKSMRNQAIFIAFFLQFSLNVALPQKFVQPIVRIVVAYHKGAMNVVRKVGAVGRRELVLREGRLAWA